MGKVFGANKSEIFQSVNITSNGYTFCTSTYSFNNVNEIDVWLFFVDKNGNKINDKLITGNKSVDAKVIIPNKGSFIMSGKTNSDSFSDGVKTGNTGFGQDMFFGKVFFFPTAIREANVEASENFKVYPNPAGEIVNFDYSFPANIIAPLNLIVTNTVGQIIKDIPLKNSVGSVQWDSGEVATGFYFYEVLCGGTILAAGKLVINR